MSRKKRDGRAKLSARELQIEVLKFLLAHPEKQYSARQLLQTLKIGNNKDSVTHALEQLTQAGSVTERQEGKYMAALDRLTKMPEAPDNPADKPVIEKFKPNATLSGRALAGKKIIEGRVDMTRSGAAYIVSEMLDSDVYVGAKHLNGALNNDTVRVLLFPAPPRRHGRPLRNPEGEVLQVTKRAREFFI
ncbi:MAG: hypothetical protein ACR2K1_14695, partial [Saprospiraceae bacterium]